MVAADLYLSDGAETMPRTAEDLAFAACLAVQVLPLSESDDPICILTRTMTAPLASGTHLIGIIIEFV